MIAIIAVLIAILIPAVQRVRANARSAQSKNNLSQLGKAMKHYEGLGKGNLKQTSWLNTLKPYADDSEKIFLDPSDTNGLPSYALSNKVHSFGSGDVKKISIIESDESTITITNTGCTGGTAAIENGPAVRHLGMVNALLYGGSVRSFEPVEIDLTDPSKEPLVTWWLPDREHGNVCGTVVVVTNPNPLPTPTGSEPDPTLTPDASEDGCLEPGGIAWTSSTVNVSDQLPPSVDWGQVESDDHIQLYLEQCGYTLPTDVQVDWTNTGVEQIFNGNISCALSPGTIPAGTVVDVYLVHFDTVTELHILTGEIQFSRPILGIIFPRTNISGVGLTATDASLGNPNTTYPTTNTRGFECSTGNGGEIVVLSADAKNVSMQLIVSWSIDQARIIVAHE